MAKKRTTHSSTCEACAHQIDFYYDIGNIPKLDMNEVITLNEAAQERAEEMIAQGYVTGELNCIITRPHRRSDKEYEVRGWWSIHRDPVTFNAVLDFVGHDPQCYLVSNKKVAVPSESDFSNDCEKIISKYWRTKKRNKSTLLKYFMAEIDKMGWTVIGMRIVRIYMGR